MYVAEVRTHVFIVFVSSAERVRLQRQKYIIVSSAISDRLQHKTGLSLVISSFVCSAISYLEVSSRGGLIASDERVRLQCNIVFRVETSNGVGI